MNHDEISVLETSAGYLFPLHVGLGRLGKSLSALQMLPLTERISMYLILVFNGSREIARYQFADQRAQYNGALGVLKAHPALTSDVYSDVAATAWEFIDANPKGRTPS